ncbi:MAG: hypothetical protein IK118_09620, partial [Clostridia bacterium]|nr:hypothetical protein [Clostridia bacterium]
MIRLRTVQNDSHKFSYIAKQIEKCIFGAVFILKSVEKRKNCWLRMPCKDEYSSEKRTGESI